MAGTQLDCSGIVSGTSIGSVSVLDGSDTGNSVGDVVEMLPTASWAQDLADALTSTHNRSGGLKTGITLTQPTVADFTNATHTHQSTAQGSVLATAALADDAVTDAKLVYGKVKSRQGGSSSDVTTAGTTTYDESGTNLIIQRGTQLIDANPKTITFPDAFSEKPQVFLQVITQVGASCYAITQTITTTTVQIGVITDAGVANTGQTVFWMAIGKV